MSYAIAFDLKIEDLERFYSQTSPNNAYNEISKFLKGKGFMRQQGSLYFGNDTIDAVGCVLTAQQLSKALPWLKDCVTDIRMLRIEEKNDLMPALNV